jgi:hypothetical protein
MEEIAEEPIALLERVTAPGIGKAALTVRAGAAQDHARSRLQQVRTCVTTTWSLLGLRDWLVCRG